MSKNGKQLNENWISENRAINTDYVEAKVDT